MIKATVCALAALPASAFFLPAPRAPRRTGPAVASTATADAGAAVNFALRGMSITLSAEITAYGKALLQPEDVRELSQLCRTGANAATVVVTDPVLLQGVVQEQQTVRGEFPGPKPVLYRPNLLGRAPAPAPAPAAAQLSVLKALGDAQGAAEAAAAAAAGPAQEGGVEGALKTAALYKANGVILPVPLELLSVGASVAVGAEALAGLEALGKATKELGLCVVPELVALTPEIKAACALTDEAQAGEILTQVQKACGCGAILVSASATQLGGDKVAPAPVRKSVCVLGEVAVLWGRDLLKPNVKELETRGYAGALLSAKSLPPSIGLLDMGRYWSAALQMCRSKRSEKFEARFLVNLQGELGGDKPDAWNEYMQMAHETGLNGAQDMNEDSDGLDESNGDFKGF